jgi:hypothetical protein
MKKCIALNAPSLEEDLAHFDQLEVKEKSTLEVVCLTIVYRVDL